MKPIYHLSLFSFLLFMVSSCNSSETANSNVEQEVVLEPIQLICQEKGESDMGIPESEVFLKLGKFNVKIANMLNCDSIPAERYSDFQIPKEAITAAGGWWAGAGDYFYLIKEEGLLNVYQGEMYEEKESTDYDYQKIASFDSEGKPIIKKTDFVGTYMTGGHNFSVVLFLGLKEGKYEAHFFEVDGMLPPMEQMNQIFKEYKPQILETFEINLEDLTFDSDLGPGKVEKFGKEVFITFYDREGIFEDQLKLYKAK